MSELQKVVVDLLGRPAEGTTNKETLVNLIQEAARYPARGLDESLAALTNQLEQLRSVSQTQVEAVGENTLAVAQNTQAHAAGGGSSAAAEIAKTAYRFLGGGLGLSPLLSGLIGLFRRGQAEAPPPLIPYTAPESIQFQGAIASSQYPAVSSLDYGQDGLPRVVQTGGPSYYPQVTVQVQAIDSRSFLDHSHEIARAVREAMLNAHALNDVVSEL